MFIIRKILVKIILTFFVSSQIQAAPTALFWTYCITDVKNPGIGNITCNNYFTVLNSPGQGSSLPPLVGFELGFSGGKNLKCEAGIDYNGGADDPFYFNGKISMEEGKFFHNAPSWSLAITTAGTKYQGHDRTNFNIINFVLGTTLPDKLGKGRVFIGGFTGNSSMGKNRQGFMAGYLQSFCPAETCEKEKYFKWEFAADYASGKNIFGGGGFGLTYYFTPGISIQMGPTWFNSAQIYGKWKWEVAINMQFSVFDPKDIPK